MPKVKSGHRLFTLLTESGTGKSKLDVIFGWFKKNRKGVITEDIPAEELLEMIEEQDDDVIPPTTKEKARQLQATGVYVPPPVPTVIDEALDYLKTEVAFEPEPDSEEEDTAPPPVKKVRRSRTISLPE